MSRGLLTLRQAQQGQQKKLAEQVCELQAVIAAQDERHQDETQV